MTCRGKLDLARRHAALCDEIERTAPPVTAPYLQAAYDRMKSPLYAFYHPNLQRFVVGRGPQSENNWLAASHLRDEITRFYLDTYDSLPATATAVPPLTQEPGTAGVGSALTSAFSSRPAAVTPSDAPAATPGVASPSDAGRPNCEAP